MREVEAERVVDASPPVVRRRLDPAALVEYEGSFEVVDSQADGDTTVVTAAASGLGLTLRFEPREGGYYYTQEGEAGPFEAMETWVETSDEDGGRGTRVRLRSRVSLGLPLSGVTNRVAAWKRRGELGRVLDALAADLNG